MRAVLVRIGGAMFAGLIHERPVAVAVLINAGIVVVVRLSDDHLEVELSAPLLAELDQLGVGRRAIDLRLATAEPAEIGPVQHQDGRHRRSPSASYAARRTASSGPARMCGSARPCRTTKRS